MTTLEATGKGKSISILRGLVFGLAGYVVPFAIFFPMCWMRNQGDETKGSGHLGGIASKGSPAHQLRFPPIVTRYRSRIEFIVLVLSRPRRQMLYVNSVQLHYIPIN